MDFKSYNLDRQFREIYSDLHTAYKRGDKVILQRSQSESMNGYSVSLLKANRHNPFLKEVHSMTPLQSRIYHESDHLLPEEQWAQITVKIKGNDSEGLPVIQMNVFERRLADKLSYMDWKLSMMADEADFMFMHTSATAENKSVANPD